MKDTCTFNSLMHQGLLTKLPMYCCRFLNQANAKQMVRFNSKKRLSDKNKKNINEKKKVLMMPHIGNGLW